MSPLSANYKQHNIKLYNQAVKAATLIGDGIIFVYPVEDVIRIRAGERGREALTYEGDIDSPEHAASVPTR